MTCLCGLVLSELPCWRCPVRARVRACAVTGDGVRFDFSLTSSTATARIGLDPAVGGPRASGAGLGALDLRRSTTWEVVSSSHLYDASTRVLHTSRRRGAHSPAAAPALVDRSDGGPARLPPASPPALSWGGRRPLCGSLVSPHCSGTFL